MCAVGVEVTECVLGGSQLDMEIRQNEQQFKHEHYIRGRRPAVTWACTRQIRPDKALCVSEFVSLCL